ncbi:DNA polymerase [Corynebacterium nuruki]|uniref:DNA polymerase n=1 Tax=Corynebacterium nuruki TaxID=1032851 RepID=UPI0039BF531E
MSNEKNVPADANDQDASTNSTCTPDSSNVATDTATVPTPVPPVAEVLDETADGYTNLTEAHAAELAASAVPPEVAAKHGVYSAATVDDLPEGARYLVRLYGAGVLPALVFPRVEADGRETWQVKPFSPVSTGDGEAKYICPRKDGVERGSSKLARIREVERPDGIIIAEGTKQSLAVAAWAPEGWSVYGIQGIRGWSADGVPTPLLKVSDGHPVVIVADADASSNLAVYEGASDLGEACTNWGATSVKYVRVPGSGTSGIDDVLGEIPDNADRQTYLERLVTNAKSEPATKPPAKRGSGKKKPPGGSNGSGDGPSDGRPMISLGDDPKDVLASIREAVIKKFSGKTLFRRMTTGVGEVYRLQDRLTVTDVTEGYFPNVIAESVWTYSVNMKGDVFPSLPGKVHVKAVLSRIARDLPELVGIARSPYVRPDGAVVSAPGYDPVSRLILDLADDLADASVPEHPTDDQVEAARALILDEMLADFLFKEQSDRAAALAALLTPIVRPMMSTSPILALSGNQPGVGKGLLVSVISLVFTGEEVGVNKLPGDDTELRKNLFASLLAGETLLMYDEVESLDGLPSINAFATAPVWADRRLGVSEKNSLTNAATVFIAGNSIVIPADSARRTVQVRLYSNDPHPESRNNFTIGNLKVWVAENRARVLGACLTLVQAWLDRGRPKPADVPRLGSFETWSETLGGILDVAGVPGFLDGLAEQRAESDWSGQANEAHLAWLYECFGGLEFEARDAVDQVLAAGDPPLPDGVTMPVNNREMGRAWGKIKDRWFGPYRLVRRVGHKKKSFWHVEVNLDELDADDPLATLAEDFGLDIADQPFAPADADGTPLSAPVPPTAAAPPAPGTALAAPTGQPDEPTRRMPRVTDVDGAARADLRHVFFDIETASVDDLYTYGPGFCRLAGYAINDGPVQLTTDMDELCDVIRSADRVVAHNGIGFDLAALAHWHGLDVEALVAEGRVRDTLLMARQSDPADSGKGGRKYNLDALGERLVNDGKASTDGVSDLKRLAKKFGGFDKIPTDDPTYRAYLVQDVELLRKVYATLPCDEYVVREHRVMWALSPISRVGLRLDVPATEARIAEGKAVVEQTRAWLADTWGLPATGKAPQQTKAGREALTRSFEMLGVTPELTKSGLPATGKDALATLRKTYADNERAVELIDALTTINGERTTPQTLLNHVGSDGHVHPSLSAGQGTGRLSLTKPGLTVLGKRSLANALERALLLPDTDDERLISVDLSQIDARAVAALSGDPAYLAMYEPGRDAHTELAVTLWNDEGRRSDAKAVGHASNYGMGSGKLAEMTGKSHAEAESYLALLKRRFPALDAWKMRTRKTAEQTGLLHLPSGRWVRVAPDKAWTGGPAGMGQGTARDLLMDGILRLPTWLRDRLRAVIHDEVILSVPADRAEEATAEVLDALQFPFTAPDGGTVEVLADSGDAGRDWADVYRTEHSEWPEMSWEYRHAGE